MNKTSMTIYEKKGKSNINDNHNNDNNKNNNNDYKNIGIYIK